MSKSHNMEFLPEDIIQNMQKNIYHNYLYFKSYSDINQNYLFIRNSLISLIQKISSKMNFKSQTYFLSIYYLDLIFLKNKIPSIYNENYELLALTCLVLAAKHLENDPTVPHLEYFVTTYNIIIKQIMHDAESKIIYNYSNISFKDLMLSEVIACKILNYKLNYFTIYDFNSFFFGHGILKIELLTDITDDSKKRKNDTEPYLDKNEDDDDELNYINPAKVKKILEKIYKKSRAFLNNVVKNKICLKYDSFLISIYLMYKSVESVIIKEYKTINEEKISDPYYIEKKEEILRRKISQCFKDIMNDNYKIDLDSMEEYQYLINDDEFLKIFDPFKYNNKIMLNNNKNEFDISERLDKIHRKYQSNNIDVFQNNNKLTYSGTIEQKEFSPKKISHMKIPSEKYNKIRRLKILERLNKNTRSSKNTFTRSFVFSNSKENISHKNINTSINATNRHKDILSKSNYNVDIGDTQYFINSSKNIMNNKTININEHNDKIIKYYKLGNKINKYKNDTSVIKDINVRHLTIFDDDNSPSPFHKLRKEKDIKINQKNVNNSEVNNIIKVENNYNRRSINLSQNINKTNQNDNNSIVIKPYAKKVIPKIENKNKKIININKNSNLNNKNENKYININNTINSIYKNRNIINISSNNLNIRNSNIGKYKNNLLENKICNTIGDQTEDSTNINPNYKKINLYKYKKTKDNGIISTNKFKNVPLLKSNIKKLSMSVNKLKINGVSNEHKFNKRLFLGMHKTPMKTENKLKSALKRNIGVKRDNNNSIINNSPENSAEGPYKDKENNVNKNDNNNKDYSSIEVSSKKCFTLKDIESNKKIIKRKNEINDNINNSNNDLIKIEKKNNDISSSSEDEEYNDEKDNNFKINNNKKNKYGDISYNYINGKVKKYNIKNFLDDMKKHHKNEKNIPKIELIQINKKKSPTIVINNNINVNFAHKSIDISRPLPKMHNYKIK